MTSTLAFESSPKERCIQIPAATSVRARRADDLALDRRRVDWFAARCCVDDPVPVRVEREGHARRHVADCNRRQRRPTALHGASAASKRRVPRLGGASRIDGAFLRREVNGHLDPACALRRMLDPQREGAARRENAYASDDIGPTLAVGAREDEVVPARTNACAALAEPVRERPQAHADDDRSIAREARLGPHRGADGQEHAPAFARLNGLRALRDEPRRASCCCHDHRLKVGPRTRFAQSVSSPDSAGEEESLLVRGSGARLRSLELLPLFPRRCQAARRPSISTSARNTPLFCKQLSSVPCVTACQMPARKGLVPEQFVKRLAGTSRGCGSPSSSDRNRHLRSELRVGRRHLAASSRSSDHLAVGCVDQLFREESARSPNEMIGREMIVGTARRWTARDTTSLRDVAGTTVGSQGPPTFRATSVASPWVPRSR